MLNKSLIANFFALAIFASGYLFKNPLILNIGLFALAGAFTNWLAVHMLFEKIPGLYGSGVIPARFEDFKSGIGDLMMQQFFTAENIDRFLSDSAGHAAHFDFAPIIDKVDMEPAYASMVSAVEESSFGSMLGMFGGTAALEPLKDPFISKMKTALIDISQSDKFNELLLLNIEQPKIIDEMRSKVESIIEQRLNELTPQLVKEIIQTMIRQHLGWLVVWGGVFGGIIGLIAALVQAQT